MLPPPLIKARYGEPVLMRIYNNMPMLRTQNNGGFGRNETQLHFHNAHNGAESDGAANVAPFPRHVLRLSLEHHACPRRQDQHCSAHRQQGVGSRR